MRVSSESAPGADCDSDIVTSRLRRDRRESEDRWRGVTRDYLYGISHVLISSNG